MALTGHLGDKPGLTSRNTLVVVQEKLAGACEQSPRDRPDAEAGPIRPDELAAAADRHYVDRLRGKEVGNDAFVCRYATILFRSSSN